MSTETPETSEESLLSSLSLSLDYSEELVKGTPSYENLDNTGKAAYWATLATNLMSLSMDWFAKEVNTTTQHQREIVSNGLYINLKDFQILGPTEYNLIQVKEMVAGQDE